MGKTVIPDWLSHGIKEKARTDVIHMPTLQTTADNKHKSSTSVASDGRHLYIHNTAGLFKVGSGYGGTIKVRRKILISK